MSVGTSENLNTENLKLIHRGLVLKYCEENNIAGVSNMLLGFTEKGIADFVKYLSQRGVEGLDLELGDSKVLLHGSNNVISVFEPRVSTGGGNSNKYEALVYATDDPEYAIFMGIVCQRGGTYGISYKREGGFTCYVDITFINSPSTIESGFVYVFSDSNFSKASNHEFTSPKEVVPIFVIPVEPGDLLITIEIKPTYTQNDRKQI